MSTVVSTVMQFVHSFFDVSGAALVDVLLGFARVRLPCRVEVYVGSKGYFPAVEIDRSSIIGVPQGISFIGTPWRGRKNSPPIFFFWTSDGSEIAPPAGYSSSWMISRLKWDIEV